MDATHPTEHAPESDLSIRELEMLLLARRRQLAIRVLRQVSLAQDEVAHAQELRRERLDEATRRDEANLLPAKAPETWRGAEGHDRYFRSLTLTPLYPLGDRQASPSPTGDGRRSSAVVVPSGIAMHRDRERSRRGYWLLAIEVVALVAFLVILGASFRQLRTLNRESREAQAAQLSTTPIVPSTRAATPPATVDAHSNVAAAPAVIIDETAAALVVMPTAPVSATATRAIESGVTPEPIERTAEARPEALPGGNRPIETRAVPSPLDGLVVATVTMVAPPTPGTGTPRRMVIPAIQVDAPIVMGDTWEDLKKGIGHHPGSALPGEPSNMVVSAHNDVYGEVFRDLAELAAGDEVLVYTDQGAFRYLVNRVDIVLPTQIEVMDPTDHAVLTMITCYPYLLDTHRVVAVADLAQE